MLGLLLHSIHAFFRSRTELVAENVALRQQLAVLKAKRPRPRLSTFDRVSWLALRRLWPRWSSALIARRAILHFNVTTNPGEDWVMQQLREAFPYDTAPGYLIFDHDAKFSPAVMESVGAMGIEPTPTAFRSPWQNGVAERWVGSVRRELFEHVVVLSEGHLRRLLRSYVVYYQADRTHLGLGKDAPSTRATTPKPTPNAKVIALPRVGGLHHRHEWRAAFFR